MPADEHGQKLLPSAGRKASSAAEDRGMLLKAFACVLIAAATAAGCTAFYSRRRGPGTAVQLSEASRWMYRRVQDLGFRGAGQYDSHMAKKMGHARARAHRERQRRERVVRRQSAACYSLSQPQCDRERDEVPVNGSCIYPAADHLAAHHAHLICGTRLSRRNPCWDDHGNVSCLPGAFVIGEMRCGTTTLYKLLGEHASVVLPTTKEPRYLTLPNYRHHTGSWYSTHFRPVASASSESITIDASPTMFNTPLLAPPFVRKWLPEARLVVLLRDPIERTYSHWRTGVSWLKSSPDHPMVTRDMPPVPRVSTAPSPYHPMVTRVMPPCHVSVQRPLLTTPR